MKQIGAASIRIELQKGEIKVWHGSEGYLLAQKLKTEVGDWTRIWDALENIGFERIKDADVLNYPCFEDWAEMYGYDTDSRAAEKIYRKCLGIKLS